MKTDLHDIKDKMEQMNVRKLLIFNRQKYQITQIFSMTNAQLKANKRRIKNWKSSKITWKKLKKANTNVPKNHHVSSNNESKKVNLIN